MIDPGAEFKFAPKAASCAAAATHARCFCTEWQVPAELPYFNGHFPQNPVLPAVAIIDATAELIGQALGASTPVLSGVKSAKFMSPITPGLLLNITIHEISGEWMAEWRNPALAATSRDADCLVALLTLRL
ncbi:MAG: beta-hydroxyacyl-ACP dehydratase [Deltaproteobacteria bacterium]|nr:beta-hydroxyacyl-ACP dehydratase [Deltaproteobacteria bacterium]